MLSRAVPSGFYFWACFFGVNVLYIARTAGGSAAEYLQVCQYINMTGMHHVSHTMGAS